MGVSIEIERIKSFGHVTGKEYSLTCHGFLQEDRTIVLNPIFNFYDALRENLPFCRCSSEVLSAPLSAKMEIIMNVRFKHSIWKLCVQIDLDTWKFSVFPYTECSAPVPMEIAMMLLTSFAIKKGRKTKNLAVLTLESGQTSFP